ncbi:rhomboid-domain-containing protein [Neocallimastix lanati (nom. inval.)]|uniref:Rhomboid-type serine protease n=1 Tax=Neocallimastix californiae TaxID=1754190 RepID=A0A1Y2FPA8_9FUNG|nr:rhomboid-domain-containing protein [Neocallimastix sp. JGI-2020a]ORY84555.1 rhomboid-domain-containing protein [Neocallimastix californiae]|eukprot:ORY84555.1 rhomboid-domain-containing protein [Neocallimastix californiae]
MKQHKPYFMYFVTLFQIAVFLFELYNNYVAMKNPFVGMNQNPMLGPSSGVLISMGARFVPCIKEIEYNQIYCPPGIKGTMDFNTTNVCNMNEVCGFGMKEGDKPNQWYRFITPIFIHCGLLHILFNLSFQVRTGIQMEKDFGTLRIAIIYMASGIFGFVFEANSAGIQPSVGCSGSLYGLMACLLLDLIQSWKLIIGPWKELIKMLFIIAFSLGIGLLPFVDNYAHIGGFIMGILTGLVLLPSIIFSKRDLRIKRILMILSIFLSIGLFVWVFRQFYYSENECKWCHYLNCLPIGNWCDSLATQTTTTTVTTTTQPPSPYNQ